MMIRNPIEPIKLIVFTQYSWAMRSFAVAFLVLFGTDEKYMRCMHCFNIYLISRPLLSQICFCLCRIPFLQQSYWPSVSLPPNKYVWMVIYEYILCAPDKWKHQWWICITTSRNMLPSYYGYNSKTKLNTEERI